MDPMAKETRQAAMTERDRRGAVRQGNSRGKRLLAAQIAASAILAIGCVYFFLPRQVKRTPPQSPSVAVPATINLILDTSASMQGYLTGRTELKETVAVLVAQLDKMRNANPQLKSISYQFAADAGTLSNSGYDSHDFIQQLLNERLMSGQASLLQEVLRNVVAETDKNTVSIVVTDSIFSYSDAQVRADPEVNSKNIAVLASDITLIFNKARSSGSSASLLAGRSHFNGKYYTYRNVARQCCTELRPYYIWLIGDEGCIRTLIEFFQKQGGPIFDHQLDFNQRTMDLPVTVLQYTEKKGTWYRDQRDKNHIEDVQPDSAKNDSGKNDPANKGLQFDVALDLSTFPKELSTVDFLSKHLLVQSSDVQIKTKAIRPKASFANSINRQDAKRLPAYTHILTISAGNSFPKHASISILIDNTLPDWYVQWSNDDDNDPQTSATTFGLKEMVNGVAAAYRKTDPIAKAEIRLDR
jgi:hypothetical protein